MHFIITSHFFERTNSHDENYYTIRRTIGMQHIEHVFTGVIVSFMFDSL